MGQQLTTEEPEVEPTPVYLHVYDVGRDIQMQAVNSILEALGTGAFHCGVEVFGHEFSFNWKPRGTGVFKCPPMQCPGHTYRTTVPMGYTMMSATQIENVLMVLKEDWQGQDYNIIRRNCCSFCDDFCKAMGVGPIPGWTTSLAGAAASVSTVCRKVAGAPETVRETIYAVTDTISENVFLWNCRMPCDRRQKGSIVTRDFVVEEAIDRIERKSVYSNGLVGGGWA